MKGTKSNIFIRLSLIYFPFTTEKGNLKWSKTCKFELFLLPLQAYSSLGGGGGGKELLREGRSFCCSDLFTLT